LENELQALRRDLADKAETHIQFSQRLKDHDKQKVKMREQEAHHQMQRTRLEFTLRTKETEIQQLQAHLAMLETQHTQLSESNRNLRHSCARYQSDIHEAEEEIKRLRSQLTSLEMHEMTQGSPMTQISTLDMRAHMNVQDKDSEIARLRARISGLQLLLRHGSGRLRSVSGGAPVDVIQE